MEHFPKIVDLSFTAQMEEDLDDIAHGEKQWVPVIKEFYDDFEKTLKQKEIEIPDKRSTYEKTGKKFKALGQILPRLREKHSVGECKQIIDTKLHDPFFQKNNYKLMNPETLFRKSHFDTYLNEKPEDFKEEKKERYSAERLEKLAIERGLYEKPISG